MHKISISHRNVLETQGAASYDHKSLEFSITKWASYAPNIDIHTGLIKPYNMHEQAGRKAQEQSHALSAPVIDKAHEVSFSFRVHEQGLAKFHDVELSIVGMQAPLL